MTLNRTDIHRPSAINPADYQFVAFEHEPKTGDVMGDAYIMLANRQAIRAHMERTGGTYSRHEHGGNCGICGSVNAIYTALFWHKPTNTYIRTGRECADRLDAGLDFARFIDGIKTEREFRAGKQKAKASLEAWGLAGAWAVFEAPTPMVPIPGTDGLEKPEFAEQTIKDIVGKLIKWGSISDKQKNFVAKLLVNIVERPARKAAFAAKKAAALDFPKTEGRTLVRGTLVSEKEVDTDFGRVTRMLVESEEGWRAWGTKPGWFVADPGDKIEFRATLKPSDKDPKFGFFKRPTNAKRLEQKEKAA